MSLIAISPGDPAGIGPEVCLKALSKNKKNYNLDDYSKNIKSTSAFFAENLSDRHLT